MSKRAAYVLNGIKFLELCLIICCIGLIDEPASYSDILFMRAIELCYVTYGCLIIYTSIYLIMAMFGDITPWRSAILWAIIAFILFIATTAVLFRDWANPKNPTCWHSNIELAANNRVYWYSYTQISNLVLAAASLSLVACTVYIADILLTLHFGKNGDLE